MTLTNDRVPTAIPRNLDSLLTDVRDWFARYIGVTDPLDIALLTIWAAHTHVAYECYSTPRLIIESSMPGSGKTTVLEHLQRFCFQPITAAAISSSAMLSRMFDQSPRTLLIDEADRSLDPKKQDTSDFLAILNTGYKRGATRPTLVMVGSEGIIRELSTFGPVAMAGNDPNLPDDTRSRSIRVLLMPSSDVAWSDWEDIEADAQALGYSLAQAMDRVRETVISARPDLPPGCENRMAEKWRPLLRVAVAAGGIWPELVRELILRDLREQEEERVDGLQRTPPPMVLLQDLVTVWPPHVDFMRTRDLIERLTRENPEYWGPMSTIGRPLSPQRMGRYLSGLKIHSSKNAQDARGYFRRQFELPWKRHGLIPGDEGSADQPF